MKWLIALAPLALGGCFGLGQKAPQVPPTQTVEVKVPVRAPCIPDEYSRKRPDYVDTNAKLRDKTPDERYQLLWAGREQRMQREKETETVIRGCEVSDQ